MTKARPNDGAGHHTQSITVNIHISGDQHVLVDPHGGRGLGSNISVLADHIAVYTYDVSALRTYAGAWIDGGYIANHRLPEKADSPVPITEYTPGVIVPAHGGDSVTHTYDPYLQHMALLIGQVRWMIHDRQAYRSMTAAFRQAKDLGPFVLAEAPSTTHDRGCEGDTSR